MQSGVISSYAYDGPSQGMAGRSPYGDVFHGTDYRMTKRRRIANGDSAWLDAAPAEQFPHEGRIGGTPGPAYGGAIDYSLQQETPDPSALNEGSEAPAQQWSSGASPYPDVSSYNQQPYFYQQTDPSIYTSPWPPADSNPYNPPTHHTAGLPASGGMPFFPSSTSAEHSNSFDAATYQQYADPEPNPQYAYGGPISRGNAVQSSTLSMEDASMHMKVQSLSILDNVATQLIHTISKASYPQIQDLMHGNESEEEQAYTTLKNLFDQTRKVYSRETPFIDAIAIQMFQPSQQEVIRKANIATFISSILGAHDVSFFHLNEFFMETFVPLGHRLLKWQGGIYLELKTQTYISALMNSDSSPEAMLDELFPPDMDAQILTRHPDTPSLSPSEQDFIDRSRARRSYLLAEPSTEEAMQELPKKYQWSDFVREFASCISKNVDGIMNVPARAQPVFGGAHADKRTGLAVQDAMSSQQSVIGKPSQAGGVINGSGVGVPGMPSLPRQVSSGEKKGSAPSSTVRQPWTTPEENALLAGLGEVNGPHWSQILALYGRGGSVSEVLKDRNQVQLKDKARNLKLWYLKMGKEVPVALRGVTGELRKRGGARARAALGMLDDEQGSGTEAHGRNGENIDPSLDAQHASRSAKKKKGGRK